RPVQKRPMTSQDDLVDDGGLALDADLLLDDARRLPFAVELEAGGVARMRPFDEEVGGVRDARGDAPGDPAVVADDDARYAGQPHPGDLLGAGREVDRVPDPGHLRREVRVVGEQRPAAGRTPRRD